MGVAVTSTANSVIGIPSGHLISDLRECSWPHQLPERRHTLQIEDPMSVTEGGLPVWHWKSNQELVCAGPLTHSSVPPRRTASPTCKEGYEGATCLIHFFTLDTP
jgi:hypothetical protein